MGMMDQMPPQTAPAPQQGMMGGSGPAQDPALSHGKFNGTVMVEGKPVQVKAGVADVDGKPYIVSDDGQLVLDSKGTLVGHIENGKFIPADQQYLKMMQDKGYVQ